MMLCLTATLRDALRLIGSIVGFRWSANRRRTKYVLWFSEGGFLRGD